MRRGRLFLFVLLLVALAVIAPLVAQSAVASAKAVSLREEASPSTVSVVRLERVEGLCCPPKFVSGDDLYLTAHDKGLWLQSRSEGRAEKLLDDALVGAWAPDGKSVAFTRRGDGPVAQVGLLERPSGQMRMIGETFIPWRLPFDAKGRLVLATKDRFRAVDLKSGESVDIPLIESRGEDPINFTELAFSPDGRHVAALEGLELSIVDLEDQTKVLVTDRIDQHRWAPFAWSSDGTQFAYSIVPEPMASPELWVANADGSGARRLLVRQDGQAGLFAGVTWLPGTRFIVYQFIPHSNVATLYAEYQVVSTDGGAPETLFKNGLGLNLSADGRTISFVRDLKGDEETGNWIAVLSY